MKNYSPKRIFLLSIVFLWTVFVVVMTTQSESVPFVHWFTNRFARTEFMATVGHTSLFGLLTGFIYMALVLRLSRSWALWLAIALALLIATYTELSQFLVAGRDSSLTDLLANWLGIFIVGFLLANHKSERVSPKTAK